MIRRRTTSNNCSIQLTITNNALIQWKRWLWIRMMMVLLLILMVLQQQQQQQQQQQTNIDDPSTTFDFPILCHAFITTSTATITTITGSAASTTTTAKVRHHILQKISTTTNVCSIHTNLVSSSTILASSTTSSRGGSSVIKNTNDENVISNINKRPLLDTTSTTITGSSINFSSNPPTVPTTLKEALRIFFWNPHYHGPRLIVLFLSILLYQRIELGSMIMMIPMIDHQSSSSLLLLWFINFLEEVGVAGMAIVFWWIQEHVLHQRLLHSQHLNWMGKDIHIQHHNQPYYHISIDSAPIMITWLMVVFVVLRFGLSTVLPLQFIYTATIAYGMAGLFYEWTHFIVHTKVRFSSNSFWTKVKNHHARHHLINHDNYFAFTITQIDDIFGTNPDVTKVPRLKKNGLNI